MSKTKVTEETYPITRTTRFIPLPFDQVKTRLLSSIKPDPNSSPLSLQSNKDVKAFEGAAQSLAGPHDFMLFHNFNHGSWYSLYQSQNPESTHLNRKSFRVIFGNPLIAITMLRHDLRAGLHVPVDALLIESEDKKGTEVVQVRPSSLIAGYKGADEELKEAAGVLDEKLERLWAWVADENGDREGGSGRL